MKAPFVAVVLLWSAVVLAQSFGGSQPAASHVAVTTPDGGLPVSITGTPTVNSQLVAPDGGLRVTLGSDVVPVSGSVSAAVTGTVAVSSAPAVTGTVAVSSLPNVNIGSSVRLDTNITNTYVPVAGDSGGARLEVAVPAGVAVTGTPNVNVANIPTVGLQNGTVVSLSSTSLGSIAASTAERSCTYAAPGPPDGAMTATVITIPPSPATPLANRTSVSIINNDTTAMHVIWCSPTGTPSSTSAIPIRSLQTLKLALSPGATVSCRCSATSCTYAYLEEKCSAPAP